MSKIKILLIGPYPPPYGGMATQIYEWQRYLAQLQSYDCAILNIGESRKAKLPGCIPARGYWDFLRTLYKFATRGYIIHLVTNGHNFKSWLSALICAIAGYLNGRKTIIVFGSGNLPDYVRQMSGRKRLVVHAAVRAAGIIICRNQSMLQALEEFGEKSRIEVMPGFTGLCGRQFGPLPRTVEEFCQTHEPLLGATVNLSPEYGVSLALQATEKLQKLYPKLGLILIGIGQEAEKHLPELRSVQPHVMLAGQLSPDVTLSVMKRLSVFLRPTYFDGDSLSVREALALGIPVVASDTGFRPNGVKLFKVGDCSGLHDQLLLALEGPGSSTKQNPWPPAEEGNARRMLDLYLKLSSAAYAHSPS